MAGAGILIIAAAVCAAAVSSGGLWLLMRRGRTRTSAAPAQPEEQEASPEAEDAQRTHPLRAAEVRTSDSGLQWSSTDSRQSDDTANGQPTPVHSSFEVRAPEREAVAQVAGEPAVLENKPAAAAPAEARPVLRGEPAPDEHGTAESRSELEHSVADAGVVGPGLAEERRLPISGGGEQDDGDARATPPDVDIPSRRLSSPTQTEPDTSPVNGGVESDLATVSVAAVGPDIATEPSSPTYSDAKQDADGVGAVPPEGEIPSHRPGSAPETGPDTSPADAGVEGELAVADGLDIAAERSLPPDDDADAGALPPERDPLSGGPGSPVETKPDATDGWVEGELVVADTTAEAVNFDVGPARARPPKDSQHRDRRGQRRTQALPKEAASPLEAISAGGQRAPAEARLRLMLHPARRGAALAAVLSRPPGYPARVTLEQGSETELDAYSDERYDDVDLEWTSELLAGEFRLRCREGLQWLRSRRRCHIFAQQPEEPGMISVGAATAAGPHAIVCSQGDEAEVRSAAEACGSVALVSHDHWTGIPDGWSVLTGYRPVVGVGRSLPSWLSTLDPGVGTEIRLVGGLEIRPRAFAEGRPPRIEISPLADGAAVTIDGLPATLVDGAWQAESWDLAGTHLIDVVPGPSSTYEVAPDPWAAGGWDAWDAHPGRFAGDVSAPWARAEICGALVFGPAGEHILAAEPVQTVVGLGLRRGVAVLRARPDVPVAVGLLREIPAFLISATGPRRTQGRVKWLSPAGTSPIQRHIDPAWAVAVRSAASKRLPFDGSEAAAVEAWRRAKERARRWKKPRP